MSVWLSVIWTRDANRAAVEAKHCAYAALSKAKYVTRCWLHVRGKGAGAAGHISVPHTLCKRELPWIIEACFFFFFEGRQTLSALVQLPPLGACGYLRVCNLLETLLHLLSSGVIKKAESESLRGAKETPLELSQTENLRAAARLSSQAACPDCVCVCVCVYMKWKKYH